MEKSRNNVNADGILQVYEDPQRPRIDAIVCITVMALFYKYNRGREVQKTWNWIYRILLHRAYLGETLYYSTPEFFLFALARLKCVAEEAGQPLSNTFISLFRKRCKELINAPGDALALAMRLLACQRAGVRASLLEKDLHNLKMAQCEDGGWPWCAMYGMPSAKLDIGNRGVSTAIAIKAIKAVEDSLAAKHTTNDKKMYGHLV
jgi:hypothetical protein